MTGYDVKGRAVVVVGAARSGLAAADLLSSRGARVVLTDLRETVPEAERLANKGVVLELGGHRPETFRRAELVVLSPGVPSDHPALRVARRSGVPIIGELELASRFLRGRIIAITGTKGKSTTTTLAGRMLTEGGHQTLVGGNIGHALSTQVDSSGPDVLHVVEVSSFQLETIERFHPWIAVLLNVFPDHLDRHQTLDVYQEAKGRVFANQTEQDWTVVNADDPLALELARRGRAQKLRFALHGSLDEGIVVANEAVSHRTSGKDTPLIPIASVRLQGSHLMADVMAAAAIGRLVGLAPAAMQRAVEDFTGLEHAWELVSEIEGVRFINDSKATNIEAARRSVESCEGRVVAILGGRFKGGDLHVLGEPLKRREAVVIALGEATSLIEAALAGTIPVRRASTMAEAVNLAFGSARPGDTVLLAPACASFDMFADYAERGRSFKQAVYALDEKQRERREH